MISHSEEDADEEGAGNRAMFVIRLPNGNLLVPDSAVSEDGQVMSEAYVEISPDDADYARFEAGALTQEEYDERRRRWQEEDEPLRQEFLDFLARHGSAGTPDDPGPGAAGGSE
jgi:hypothetical protein